MTIVEMLGQSGILTLLGMGVVFGFLIIMVISITLAGKIIHAVGLDKDVAPSGSAGSGIPGGAAAAAKTAAAITAAVNEYRKTNS
jgi:oxaloacetate decarboxylase gamma subunit